jgi:hypothetical protein
MGRILRFISILWLSISAAFNIAGGVGTTCVALNPAGWEGFEGIARFQWLYLLYVVVTLTLGLMMVRGVLLLRREGPSGYRYTLFTLAAAIVVGAIHMVTSRALRDSGSSMPVDVVVYITGLSLALFLFLRIPGLWEEVGYGSGDRGKDSGDAATGTAAIVCGVLTWGMPWMTINSHTIDGVNYGAAFGLTTAGTGVLLISFGAWLVFRSRITLKAEKRRQIRGREHV